MFFDLLFDINSKLFNSIGWFKSVFCIDYKNGLAVLFSSSIIEFFYLNGNEPIRTWRGYDKKIGNEELMKKFKLKKVIANI